MNLQSKKKLLIFVFLITTFLVSYIIYLPLRVNYLINNHHLNNQKLNDSIDDSINEVIILGAKVKPNNIPSLSLKYRIEEACALHYLYPNLTYIASGGQGNDEPISEALMIKMELEKCGILEDKIILEDKSKNTNENLKNSKTFLTSNNVIIITSDFHTARSEMLAKRYELEPTMIGAKTPTSVKISSWIREYLAYIKSYVLDR